jgi:hypothetical protein
LTAADDRPLLPDRTSDENDVGWGDRPVDGDVDRDEELRRDVPPHHHERDD